jgi:type IV secretory pathway component VirB8
MADLPWVWVLASAVVVVSIVIIIMVVFPLATGRKEGYALGVNEADSIGITVTTQMSEYQKRYGTHRPASIGYVDNRTPY